MAIHNKKEVLVSVTILLCFEGPV